MNDPTRRYLKIPVWARYLLAIAIFAVMLAICLAVQPVDSEAVYLIFFPGVAITAFLCGVEPGLLFLVLATSASSNVFFTPHWNLHELSPKLPIDTEFVVPALFILGIMGYFQRQAEGRHRRLEDEISERRRLQAQSEESSARFAAIFDSAMDAIISVDIQQRVVLFNPSAEKMFGYAAADILGLPIDKLIPSRFRQMNVDEMQQFSTPGNSGRKVSSLDELTGLRRDGSEFPVEASVSMTIVSGSPILTIILRDVSERHKAEQRLSNSRQQLKMLIDQIPVSVAMLDSQLNYIATSRHWLVEYGHGFSSLAGRQLYEVNPDVKDEWRLIFRDALAGTPAQNNRDLWIRSDGSRRWLRWAVHPWLDEQYAVGGIIIFAEDISRHLLTEAALQASENDLVRAQSVANIGSWRLNVLTDELTWSSENYHIFGIPEGTPLRYDTFIDCVHPDDRDYVDRKWKTCLLGEPYDIEHRLLIDGQVKWVCEKAQLEFDEAGMLLGGFGITQDITEKRLVENQLKEANSRLAAVADEQAEHLQELSSALTRAEQMERDRIYELLHDHVQPLLVATRLGLSGLTERTPLAEWPQVVDKAKQSLSQVIQTARSLSTELSPPLIREAGLLAALESLCRLVRLNYGLEVDMSSVSGAEPASMTIRLMCFNAIRELLMNVVKHAGTLRVKLDLTTELPNRLRITLRDDGLGFEPSAPVEGSGLANHKWRLGMVGGELLIESSKGTGTQVTILAPLDMRDMEHRPSLISGTSR